MEHEPYIHLTLPGGIDYFHFPESLNRRLHDLLDKQDQGQSLTSDERSEAEGLVEVAEMISILRARYEHARRQSKDAA